ncbi:MAG: phytoene synthase [Synechococcales cyanobacterium RM1_1_8]|nr:phytoene synthase [Synechococcales cyanobacterium RM1_1_8]
MLQLTETPIRSAPQMSVDEAYERCREVTATYSKSFYLATLLMTEQKRRAIWAIYLWCRRTDELVDGPAAATTTPATLDRWERQLELLFNGVAVDDEDVALVDTLANFAIDIQPFRDMIDGQRMDLERNRYETFEELKLYCYRVAGTVGLMSTVVMGADPPTAVAPWDKPRLRPPTEEAVALGMANQLTNILRDVGEDARRGRIYLPLEDLAMFDYTEAELMQGLVDDRWRALMKFQIQRARKYYAEAEQGIRALNQNARWPVWSSLMVYSQILDAIEANDYDVFSQRAYVPGWQKLLTLPVAWLRANAL